MKLAELVKNFNLKTVARIRAAKYAKIDYGIVKVALMVAAVDGEVSDDELKALDALLKKCRGYSQETAAKVQDEAMRSAGYLLLLGRRIPDREFVKAFVAEARTALPDGFEDFSVEEVRRAIVMWIAMGMSDGDYSPREKKCIEALCECLAELKVARDDDRTKSRTMFASAFSMASGSSWQKKMNDALPRNFLTRVADLVAQYGDSADAVNELEKLIAAGRG